MGASSYRKIFEHVYSDTSGTDERIQALPYGQRLPFKTIELLSDRKGFDWWWEDIEPSSRTEIFTELTKLFNKEKTT